VFGYLLFVEETVVATAHIDKLADSFEVYSKREMATRRSSARRRYNSCIVRSASSWSEVSSRSEAISRSMASILNVDRDR
jgi:hypothetical protein